MPLWTPARKLIAAALALTGCRVLSAWDSILAGALATAIVFALAASLVVGMPRTRRLSVFVALPLATVANALVLALGGFLVLLGANGLLADGRIAGGPPWNWNFVVVPVAAAANLIALVRPSLASRSRLGVWAANLASVVYVVSDWRMEHGWAHQMVGLPVAVEGILLVGCTMVSLALVAWDGHDQPPVTDDGRPRLRRRRLLLGSAILIVGLLWLALLPVYHKRQIAYSLNSYGLRPNFGTVFPSWRLPFELPFEWYAYLGEVTGVSAPKSIEGDAMEASRLMNNLPWLESLFVNQLEVGGERILKPLSRLRQIALIGPGVTDKTLADAARLPALNNAVFDAAKITDEGLINLAKAPWLQRLTIRRTPITGDGLAYLKPLRLTWLDLTDTKVGDRQVAVLPEFKSLTSLSLIGTSIGDDGLKSLAQCKRLRLVELRGTRVTAQGVERLRRALPACEVVWDP